MKVLVAGGAGYIGSVVTQQLIEAGHAVTIDDNLSQGHRRALPDQAQVVSDFQDLELPCGGTITDRAR